MRRGSLPVGNVGSGAAGRSWRSCFPHGNAAVSGGFDAAPAPGEFQSCRCRRRALSLTPDQAVVIAPSASGSSWSSEAGPSSVSVEVSALRGPRKPGSDVLPLSR